MYSVHKYVYKKNQVEGKRIDSREIEGDSSSPGEIIGWFQISSTNVFMNLSGFQWQSFVRQPFDGCLVIFQLEPITVA